MELYTALVKEFHNAGRKQVLGVFIRDVNPEPSRQESLGFPPAVTPPRSSSPSRRSSLFPLPTPIRGVESPDTGTYFMTSSSTTAPAATTTTSPLPYTDRFPKQYVPETASGLTKNTSVDESELARNAGAPSSPLPQRLSSMPSPPRHQDSADSTMSDPAIAAAIASAAASAPSLTKKRAEFKLRLAKAREGMPPDVPFIVFVHPEECIQIANNILDSLGVGGPRKS